MDTNKEDNKSEKKTVIFSALAAFAILDILILLCFLLTYCNNRGEGETSSSIEESSSTIEITSSVEPSSLSTYDPYIDTVISNIKKYIKDVGETMFLGPYTVKDIYSINTYVESESTHLIYGFTYLEEDDKYIRLDLNLEQELSEEEIVALIHDDNITLDMYEDEDIYDIASEDITSKDTFKDVYPGDYSHHIIYKNDYEEYYMSGIGHHDDAYISVDLLSFDKDTYDIDNTDTSINQSNDINKRYYQLLETLVG